MLRFLTLLLLLIAAAAAASPPASTKSIYIMRHLQKGSGDDPGLSEQGAAGARALARWFGADRPAAIYVSTTRRAMETAAPLAQALGLTPKQYDPSAPAALIEAVRSETGSILIVGHSNTVPDLVERLGGARPASLADSDYGDIWRIAGSKNIVERLKLGGE